MIGYLAENKHRSFPFRADSRPVVGSAVLNDGILLGVSVFVPPDVNYMYDEHVRLQAITNNDTHYSLQFGLSAAYGWNTVLNVPKSSGMFSRVSNLHVHAIIGDVSQLDDLGIALYETVQVNNATGYLYPTTIAAFSGTVKKVTLLKEKESPSIFSIPKANRTARRVQEDYIKAGKADLVKEIKNGQLTIGSGRRSKIRANTAINALDIGPGNSCSSLSEWISKPIIQVNGLYPTPENLVINADNNFIRFAKDGRVRVDINDPNLNKNPGNLICKRDFEDDGPDVDDNGVDADVSSRSRSSDSSETLSSVTRSSRSSASYKSASSVSRSDLSYSSRSLASISSFSSSLSSKTEESSESSLRSTPSEKSLESKSTRSSKSFSTESVPSLDSLSSKSEVESEQSNSSETGSSASISSLTRSSDSTVVNNSSQSSLTGTESAHSFRSDSSGSQSEKSPALSEQSRSSNSSVSSQSTAKKNSTSSNSTGTYVGSNSSEPLGDFTTSSSSTPSRSSRSTDSTSSQFGRSTSSITFSSSTKSSKSTNSSSSSTSSTSTYVENSSSTPSEISVSYQSETSLSSTSFSSSTVGRDTASSASRSSDSTSSTDSTYHANSTSSTDSSSTFLNRTTSSVSPQSSSSTKLEYSTSSRSKSSRSSWETTSRTYTSRSSSTMTSTSRSSNSESSHSTKSTDSTSSSSTLLENSTTSDTDSSSTMLENSSSSYTGSSRSSDSTSSTILIHTTESTSSTGSTLSSRSSRSPSSESSTEILWSTSSESSNSEVSLSSWSTNTSSSSRSTDSSSTLKEWSTSSTESSSTYINNSTSSTSSTDSSSTYLENTTSSSSSTRSSKSSSTTRSDRSSDSRSSKSQSYQSASSETSTESSVSDISISYNLSEHSFKSEPETPTASEVTFSNSSDSSSTLLEWSTTSTSDSSSTKKENTTSSSQSSTTVDHWSTSSKSSISSTSSFEQNSTSSITIPSDHSDSTESSFSTNTSSSSTEAEWSTSSESSSSSTYLEFSTSSRSEVTSSGSSSTDSSSTKIKNSTSSRSSDSHSSESSLSSDISKRTDSSAFTDTYLYISDQSAGISATQSSGSSLVSYQSHISGQSEHSQSTFELFSTSSTNSSSSDSTLIKRSTSSNSSSSSTYYEKSSSTSSSSSRSSLSSTSSSTSSTWLEKSTSSRSSRSNSSRSSNSDISTKSTGSSWSTASSSSSTDSSSTSSTYLEKSSSSSELEFSTSSYSSKSTLTSDSSSTRIEGTTSSSTSESGHSDLTTGTSQISWRSSSSTLHGFSTSSLSTSSVSTNSSSSSSSTILINSSSSTIKEKTTSSWSSIQPDLYRYIDEERGKFVIEWTLVDENDVFYYIPYQFNYESTSSSNSSGSNSSSTDSSSYIESSRSTKSSVSKSSNHGSNSSPSDLSSKSSVGDDDINSDLSDLSSGEMNGALIPVVQFFWDCEEEAPYRLRLNVGDPNKMVFFVTREAPYVFNRPKQRNTIDMKWNAASIETVPRADHIDFYGYANHRYYFGAFARPTIRRIGNFWKIHFPDGKTPYAEFTIRTVPETEFVVSSSSSSTFARSSHSTLEQNSTSSVTNSSESSSFIENSTSSKSTDSTNTSSSTSTSSQSSGSTHSTDTTASTSSSTTSSYIQKSSFSTGSSASSSTSSTSSSSSSFSSKSSRSSISESSTYLKNTSHSTATSSTSSTIQRNSTSSDSTTSESTNSESSSTSSSSSTVSDVSSYSTMSSKSTPSSSTSSSNTSSSSSYLENTSRSSSSSKSSASTDSSSTSTSSTYSSDSSSTKLEFSTSSESTTSESTKSTESSSSAPLFRSSASTSSSSLSSNSSSTKSSKSSVSDVSTSSTKSTDTSSTDSSSTKKEFSTSSKSTNSSSTSTSSSTKARHSTSSHSDQSISYTSMSDSSDTFSSVSSDTSSSNTSSSSTKLARSTSSSTKSSGSESSSTSSTSSKSSDRSSLTTASSKSTKSSDSSSTVSLSSFSFVSDLSTSSSDNSSSSGSYSSNTSSSKSSESTSSSTSTSSTSSRSSKSTGSSDTTSSSSSSTILRNSSSKSTKSSESSSSTYLEKSTSSSSSNSSSSTKHVRSTSSETSSTNSSNSSSSKSSKSSLSYSSSTSSVSQSSGSSISKTSSSTTLDRFQTPSTESTNSSSKSSPTTSSSHSSNSSFSSASTSSSTSTYLEFSTSSTGSSNTSSSSTKSSNSSSSTSSETTSSNSSSTSSSMSSTSRSSRSSTSSSYSYSSKSTHSTASSTSSTTKSSASSRSTDSTSSTDSTTSESTNSSSSSTESSSTYLEFSTSFSSISESKSSTSSSTSSHSSKSTKSSQSTDSTSSSTYLEKSTSSSSSSTSSSATSKSTSSTESSSTSSTHSSNSSSTSSSYSSNSSSNSSQSEQSSQSKSSKSSDSTLNIWSTSSTHSTNSSSTSTSSTWVEKSTSSSSTKSYSSRSSVTPSSISSNSSSWSSWSSRSTFSSKSSISDTSSSATSASSNSTNSNVQSDSSYLENESPSSESTILVNSTSSTDSSLTSESSSVMNITTSSVSSAFDELPFILDFDALQQFDTYAGPNVANTGGFADLSMRDANIIYKNNMGDVVNRAMVLKMKMTEGSRSGQQALYIYAENTFLNEIDVEVLEVEQFNPYYFPKPEGQNRSFGEMHLVNGAWQVNPNKRYVSARVLPAKWVFEDSSSSTSADLQSGRSDVSDSQSSKTSNSQSSKSGSMSKSSDSTSSSTKNLSSDGSVEFGVWTRRKYAVNFRADATYLVVITPRNITHRNMHANFTIAVKSATIPDAQVDLVSSSSHHDTYAYPTGKIYTWSNRRYYTGEGYPSYNLSVIPPFLSNLFRTAPTGYDENGIAYVDMQFRAEASNIYALYVRLHGTAISQSLTVGDGLKAIYFGEDITRTKPQNWFMGYSPKSGMPTYYGGTQGQATLLNAVKGHTYYFRVFNTSINDDKRPIDPFIRLNQAVEPRGDLSGIYNTTPGMLEVTSSTFAEKTTSSSRSSDSSSSYFELQSLLSKSTLSSTTLESRSSRSTQSLSSYDSRTDRSDGVGSLSGEFVGFDAMSDVSDGILGNDDEEDASQYFYDQSGQEYLGSYSNDMTSANTGWCNMSGTDARYVDFQFTPAYNTSINNPYIYFNFSSCGGETYLGLELLDEFDNNISTLANINYFDGNCSWSGGSGNVTLNGNTQYKLRLWDTSNSNDGYGTFSYDARVEIWHNYEDIVHYELESVSSHSSLSKNIMSDVSDCILGNDDEEDASQYFYQGEQWIGTVYSRSGSFGGYSCCRQYNGNGIDSQYNEDTVYNNSGYPFLSRVEVNINNNSNDYYAVEFLGYGTDVGPWSSTQFYPNTSMYSSEPIVFYNLTDSGDGLGNTSWDGLDVSIDAWTQVDVVEPLESRSSHSSGVPAIVFKEYSSFSSLSSHSSDTSYEENSTSSDSTTSRSTVSLSSKSIHSDLSTDSSSSYIEGFLEITQGYPRNLVFADDAQGYDGVGRATIRLKWRCPRAGTYYVRCPKDLYGGDSYAFYAVYTNNKYTGSPVISGYYYNVPLSFAATKDVDYYFLVRPTSSVYNNRSVKLELYHTAYAYNYASSSISSSSSTYHNFNSSRSTRTNSSISSSSSTEFENSSIHSSSSYLLKESVSTSSSSADRIYIFEGEEWRSRYGSYTGPVKALSFYYNKFSTDAQGRNEIYCGFRVPATASYSIRVNDVSGLLPVFQGTLYYYGTDSSFQAVSQFIDFTTNGTISDTMTEGFTYWFKVKTRGENAISLNNRTVNVSVYNAAWPGYVSDSSSTFRKNTSSHSSESSTVNKNSTSSTELVNSTSSKESESSELINSTSSESISSIANQDYRVIESRLAIPAKFQFVNPQIARVNGVAVDPVSLDFSRFGVSTSPVRPHVSARVPINLSDLYKNLNAWNWGSIDFKVDLVVKANFSERISRFVPYGTDIDVVLRIRGMDQTDPYDASDQSSASAPVINNTYVRFTIKSKPSSNDTVIRGYLSLPAMDPYRGGNYVAITPVTAEFIVSAPFTQGYNFTDDCGLELDLEANIWRIASAGSRSEEMMDVTSDSSSAYVPDYSVRSYESNSTTSSSVTDTPSEISATSSSTSSATVDIKHLFQFETFTAKYSANNSSYINLFRPNGNLAQVKVNTARSTLIRLMSEQVAISGRPYTTSDCTWWGSSHARIQLLIADPWQYGQLVINWETGVQQFSHLVPTPVTFSGNVTLEREFDLREVVDNQYGAGTLDALVDRYVSNGWAPEINVILTSEYGDYALSWYPCALYRIGTVTYTDFIESNSSIDSVSYPEGSTSGSQEIRPAIMEKSTGLGRIMWSTPTSILADNKEMAEQNIVDGGTNPTAPMDFGKVFYSPDSNSMEFLNGEPTAYYSAGAYKSFYKSIVARDDSLMGYFGLPLNVKIKFSATNSAYPRTCVVARLEGPSGYSYYENAYSKMYVFYVEEGATGDYEMSISVPPLSISSYNQYDVEMKLHIAVVRPDSYSWGQGPGSLPENENISFTDISATLGTTAVIMTQPAEYMSYSSSNSSAYLNSTSTQKDTLSSTSTAEVNSSSSRSSWHEAWVHGNAFYDPQYYGGNWMNPNDVSWQSRSTLSSAEMLFDTESTDSTDSESANELSSNSSSSDVNTTSESLVSNYGIKARTFALVAPIDETRIYFEKLDFISTSATKTFYRAVLKIAQGVGDPCGKNKLYAKLDSDIGQSSTEQFGSFDVRIGIGELNPTGYDPIAGELLLDRCDAPYAETQAYYGDLTIPVGLTSVWSSFVAARALSRLNFKQITDKKVYASNGTEAVLKAEGVNYTTAWTQFREAQYYSVLVVYSSHYSNILGDGFYITIKNYE